MAETQKYTSTATRPDGSQIDWHDYIVIEDHFMPEEREMIETSLNQLVQIPKFQEILIRTQSPEVMEAWRKLVALLSNSYGESERIIEDSRDKKYTHPDNHKLHIVNSAGEKVTAYFREFTRCVGLDLARMGQAEFKTDQEEWFSHSVQSCLAHEIIHASRAQEYRKPLEITKASLEALKAQDGFFLSEDNIKVYQNSMIGLLELLSISRAEPEVVAETNEIAAYFGDPPRGHYLDAREADIMRTPRLGVLDLSVTPPSFEPKNEDIERSSRFTQLLAQEMLKQTRDKDAAERNTSALAVAPNYNPDEIEWSKKDFVQKSDKPIIR